MCGLVAALGSVDLSPALQSLSYRGIRSQVYSGRYGSIGHTRLPIVGLDASNDQPVRREGWTIAFVGEILDFRDTDRNAVCDLDLVVDRWLDDGPHSLTDRDGFWSVVALSDQRDELWGFVDYLAQKPLYYRDDLKAIASEPDALVALGRVTPSEIYYSTVAKFGYCPFQNMTPYNEVFKLPPGCAIKMTAADTVISMVDGLRPNRTASVNDLAIEIEAAVRRRVVSSDVGVAALVSGGVDSSIVYKLASRYGNIEPYYCPAGWPALSGEEWDRVRLLCGSEVRVVNQSSVSMSKGVDYMQEPVDLGSLLPQVALSDAIEGRATVCLTGDGADESFGGYGRSSRYDSQYSDIYTELVCYHLPRLDRVMMRNRIEVRSPFLARRVVEIAMGLPHSYRIDKKTLRSAFAGLIGKELAYAPKIPLRTGTIEMDRERNTLRMIEIHRRRFSDVQTVPIREAPDAGGSSVPVSDRRSSNRAVTQ